MIHSEKIYFATQQTERHESEPVKTFEEIAQELGCTKRYVWQLYKNAMKKIRKQPGAAEALRELIFFRNARVF